MDRVVFVAAFVKLALIVYAAVVSSPPVAEAFRQTFLPDTIDFATITTIVGGTVGGFGGTQSIDRRGEASRPAVEHERPEDIT